MHCRNHCIISCPKSYVGSVTWLHLLLCLPSTFPKILGRLGLLLMSEGLGPQVLFNSKIASWVLVSQVLKIIKRYFCGTHWTKVKQSVKSPFQFSSVTQSCPTLWPHGLQHARPPCLSPTAGVCSNSCPLSRWCHPTISSSVVPFSSTFNLSQHQGLFKCVSSHQVAKVLKFHLQHQSFHWIFRTDLL